MRTLVRISLAGALVVSGLVHLQLWQDGYRYVDDVGPLFLLQAAVAAGLAVAVLARPGVVVLAAVIGFSLSSVAALVMSRGADGFLGFMERGWSADATQALVAECAAAFVAAALLMAGRPAVRRA
jgi:hypothetical protein